MADVSKYDMTYWLKIGDYERRRYGLVADFYKGYHGRLLDVGCHKGELARFLPPEIEYVGADNVVEAFRGAVHVDLNEKHLPFADRSFGAVVCIATLEHLFYPLELLQECARVLTDDGRALVSLPNDRGLSGIVAAVFGGIAPYETAVGDHHWKFDLPAARNLFTHVFEIEREEFHVGPLYERYLWFLKKRSWCTELFMFGPKKAGGRS